MKKKILFFGFIPFLLNPFAFLENQNWSSRGGEVSTKKWQIETRTSSPSEVTVKVSDGEKTTTSTIHAPYGVRSEIVMVNGKTFATSTPITESDLKEMEKKRRDLEERMTRLFDEQDRFFREFWKNI